MPAGRRRHSSRELIVPIALGLTAAIASVGLYLWADTDPGYPSSSDEDRKKERRRRKLKPRGRFEPVPGPEELKLISEEDTDDLKEDRRRDEEWLRLKGKSGSVGTVMPGAVQVEKVVKSTAIDVAGKAEGLVIGALPVQGESPAVKELKKEASMEKPQYVPPPAKKRTVVVVVSERKALEGHDSDSDYEETGLPSSLLLHLPCPLDLSLTELNILISSPHLSTHPLIHLAETQSSRLTRKDSTSQSSSYFPAPRRPPNALSPNASTYNLATSVLPISYPLEHILPFTDPASIPPILRTLAPEIVYIEEPLTIPSNGTLVSGLLEGGWVGIVVVVLIGEDDQLAGLIDSEDEEESQSEIRRTKGEGKWWGDNSSTGIRARFGGRVQVVEGWVLMEDWRRRVDERG